MFSGKLLYISDTTIAAENGALQYWSAFHMNINSVTRVEIYLA
jgi:hypothetical protein